MGLVSLQGAANPPRCKAPRPSIHGDAARVFQEALEARVPERTGELVQVANGVLELGSHAAHQGRRRRHRCHAEELEGAIERGLPGGGIEQIAFVAEAVDRQALE